MTRLALIVVACVVFIGTAAFVLTVAWLTLKPLTFALVLGVFIAWAVVVARFTR